jgi:hypothetical protein
MPLANINTADFIIGDSVAQDGNVITVGGGSGSGTYSTGQIFVNFLGGLQVQAIWPIYYISSVGYDPDTDTETLATADANI